MNDQPTPPADQLLGYAGQLEIGSRVIKQIATGLRERAKDYDERQVELTTELRSGFSQAWQDYLEKIGLREFVIETIRLGICLEFEYDGGSEDLDRRIVRPSRVEAHTFTAYDFDRMAPRSFRFDRMLGTPTLEPHPAVEV